MAPRACLQGGALVSFLPDMDFSELTARAPWRRSEIPAPQAHGLVLGTFLEAFRHSGVRIMLPPAGCGLEAAKPGFVHVWSEVFMQVCGERRFTFAHGRSLVLGAGQIALVPKGVQHVESYADRGHGHACLVAMCFRGALSLHLAVRRPDGEQSGTHYDRYADERGLTSELLCEELLMSQRSGEDARSQATIAQTLLLHFQRCARGPSLHEPGQSPLLDRCQRLVKARLFEPDMSVALLAKELGCHPDHLGRRFRAATGESLVGWIARERMALAATMLKEGDHDVRHVALVCGYRDAAYFSRVFRRCRGVSPAQFQRGQRSPSR